MIGFFAAHKIAVMFGMAAVALVLMLRSRGAAAAGLPNGFPVSPYSSTAPSDGSGSLSLSLPGYNEATPTAVATVDSAGTGAGPSVADASTSTGPGAGPTMADPISYSYVDPDPPTVNGTPVSEGFVSSTIGGGSAWEQSAPGSDYYVPVPIQEVAPTSPIRTPGLQI